MSSPSAAAQAVYRGMDQAALDAAYDNRRAFPHFAERARQWSERSRALLARVRVERDVPYGLQSRARIDFLHCGERGRPTLAFIHGGYWQWNDKADHAFVAEGLLDLGVNVALIGYSLAPALRVSRIVQEASAAVAWLQARLTSRFGASEALVVSGHSAGGQLAAIAAETPGVRGALLVSGVYDLDPIRRCYLNAVLGLDAAEVEQVSPRLRRPPGVPVCVAVGRRELPELVRQSVEYAAYLESHEVPSTLVHVPEADHFLVLEALADRRGALCAAANRMLGVPGGPSSTASHPAKEPAP